MSKNITGNPDNFHAAITVPTDGDVRNAASVETPFQQLADNVAHYGRIVTDGGLTRQGVTRIRSVETIDELKALSGMAVGDVCMVGRFGTYIYAGPLAGGYDVWVVESTAVPGTYWRHSLLDMTAHTTGLVRRDTQGRIPAALPKNGVVGIATLPATTIPAPTTVPDYSPGTFAELDLGELQAGDIIDVIGFAMVALSQSPYTAALTGTVWREGTEVTYGTGDPVIPVFVANIPHNVTHTFNFIGRLVVKNAGVHTLRITAQRSGGDAWMIGVRCGVTIYRP